MPKKKVEIKQLPFQARIEGLMAEVNPLMEKWGITIGAESVIEEGLIKAIVKGYDRYNKGAGTK